MKKFLFALPLLALSLWSCSDEPAQEPEQDQDKTEMGTGEPKYLAVKITTSNDSRSRAEGVYEDGEAAESKVNNLYFYFFDADGNPARVKSDGSNAMSVTNIQEETDPSDNVTKTIKAVLVIETRKGDAIPAQIVAIVNKIGGLDRSGFSIDALQNMETPGYDTKTGFVMSNSAYVAGNALHIGADVAGHLFSSDDEALANPVTIYVERALAKVKLTSKIAKAEGLDFYDPSKTTESGVKDEIFSTVEDTKDGQVTTNKKIYVKFLGWNTTARSQKNRLIKSIDPLWNAGWQWYDAYRFRSFWAINHTGNTEYDYFDFDQDGANAATGFTAFDGTQWSYIKENAAVADANNNIISVKPNNPSQVIIGAQLVDEEGNPIEMAEWAGQRMAVDDLKIAFANAVSLYKKTQVENPYYNPEGESELEKSQYVTVYTKISPEEIELKTATAAGYLDANDNRRYLTYAVLTEEAAATTWYGLALNNDTLNPALDDKGIKDAFFSIGGAKVWTEGKTYYYFNIRHLAYGIDSAEFGQLGVVRNHVYDTNVTSLVGLGTPVYDPDETIIPEKPSDNDTYIAAEIKVLSWRIVSQDIPLEW